MSFEIQWIPENIFCNTYIASPRVALKATYFLYMPIFKIIFFKKNNENGRIKYAKKYQRPLFYCAFLNSGATLCIFHLSDLLTVG